MGVCRFVFIHSGVGALVHPGYSSLTGPRFNGYEHGRALLAISAPPWTIAKRHSRHLCGGYRTNARSYSDWCMVGAAAAAVTLKDRQH